MFKRKDYYNRFFRDTEKLHFKNTEQLRRFFDTHCVFSYKPKKSVKQKPYLVVFVLDEAHLSLDDNIHNLEDFTNDFVKNILAKNSDLKLTVNYQEHTLYKKYSTVSYKTSFLGNTYTSLNVSFLLQFQTL